MKTTVNKVGQHTVVALKGHIHFETIDKLEQELEKIISHTTPDQVLLDLRGLDFVGSSGIEKFLHLLKTTFEGKAKCIGMKNEFKRCLTVFSHGNNKFKYYSNINEAIDDFDADLQNKTLNSNRSEFQNGC